MEPTMSAAARKHSGSFWVNLSIDRTRDEPLQRQLFDQIRSGIVGGSLPPGTRLPASRLLASEVGCSRNTVLEVLGQLIAEGYLHSVRGSGIFIGRDVPDETLSAAATEPEPDLAIADAGVPALSARGEAAAAARLGYPGPRHVAFSPSMPDVSLFPIATWMQLTTQEWRQHGSVLLTEGDPRGFEPLRHAIAEYVYAARNVACDADQVIITAGAHQGIDLTARLLLDPGDRAWVEDPGYPAIRELFRAAGAEVVPVELDSDGLSLEAAAAFKAPRLIAISPSHQFPTGVSMSLERRSHLLEYAERVGAWIVEDDYDSEFRYEGRPLAALASMGAVASARVIYIGTFSKVLFPAIRLGFLVVPKHIAARFRRARMIVDRQPSIFAQPTLARFIAEGHLATHVRRMRRLYRQRREALLEALATHAPALFTTGNDPAGMHLFAEFTPQLARRYHDVTAAEIVVQRGVNAQPISMYYADRTAANGFVLGYACAHENALTEAVATMAAALRE